MSKQQVRIRTNHTVMRQPDVIHAEVDGEVVLMDVESGRYHGLDSVGSVIWRQLESPVIVGQLVSDLETDFDGDRETIESDVFQFLEKLVEQNLAVLN